MTPAGPSAASSAGISVYVTEPVHAEAQALLAQHVRVEVGDEAVTQEELRREWRDEVNEVEIDDPVIHLDLNTAEDYERARALYDA